MPRNFNGTSDYISAGIGNLNGVGGGAVTVAAIVRINSTSHNGAVIYGGSGTGLAGIDLEVYGGEWYGGSQAPALATASAADGWTLIAYAKASGTVTPRFHKLVYSTGTWTHANASGTHDNGVAVDGDDVVQFGRWADASERFDGDIALGAVWDRQLTDNEIKLLGYTLQAWYASAPRGAWILDQADTSQKVTDWTGGGANETGISGTTVSAQSVPQFTYGFSDFIPHSVTASGTEFTQSVSGSCTGSGAIVRQTTRTVAGSSTGSSTTVRQTSRLLAGSASPAGTVSKLTATLKAGAAAAAGAILRSTSRLLAGSSTGTGATAKLTVTSRAGTTTPAGGLTYSRVVIKALEGAVTAAGSLTRSISKMVVGTVTGSSVLTRAIAVTRAGSVTAAGAVLKLISRALGGSVTSQGSVATVLADDVVPGRLNASITGPVLGASTATPTLGASAPGSSLTPTIGP